VPIIFRPSPRSVEEIIVDSISAAFSVNSAARNTHGGSEMAGRQGQERESVEMLGRRVTEVKHRGAEGEPDQESGTREPQGRGESSRASSGENELQHRAVDVAHRNGNNAVLRCSGGAVSHRNGNNAVLRRSGGSDVRAGKSSAQHRRVTGTAKVDRTE